MRHLITALRATTAAALVGGFAGLGAATAAADPGTGNQADINTLAKSLSKGYRLGDCAPQPLTEGVIAQIACNQNDDPNGPAGAQYFLFDDPNGPAAAFKSISTQDGIKLADCGDTASPTTWSQSGIKKGQVACATVKQQGGVAQIMWTTDAKNVFSFIRGANGDVSALYKWWVTNG